ncbi:porin, partial [Methylobacterium mesophilicum]
MKLLKSSLLGSAAAFAAIGAAQAADLSIKKAAPIEYVRVCSAFGAGFAYIPSTDTCLRISGRARFEGGYMASYSRQGGNGDTSGYQGR